MKSIFLCEVADNPERVFSKETVALLKEKSGLEEAVYNKDFLYKNPDKFTDTRYIFSTWGMSELTEEEIERFFPRLECVFYAAGTVQYFARPFLNKGIRIFSAWAANAVPVAEYTLAQILLANKGFFLTSRLQSTGETRKANAEKEKYKGNFGETVGIIGAGMIGSLVIEMLKNYKLNVKVFDPFLPDEKAEKLGVEKCPLEEIFSTCSVVSNHLANNEQTQGMLKKEHFSAMLPYATFINTGRGAQVVEKDLADVLESRPDLTALLDVTHPEPPEEGHAFYALPNCILTPHIAGSSGNEVHRMAEYMAEEYLRFAANEPCRYEVTLKMLETMA